MQQSLKKRLTLVSSIVNLVLGALLIIISISGIFNCVSIYVADGANYVKYSVAAFVVDLVLRGIDIAIGALIILFNSLTLTEKHRNNRAFYITSLVFFGLWFFSSIIINAWLSSILSLIAIGLIITIFVLKDSDTDYSGNTQKKRVPAQSTLEMKIEELKHFKELGIITDEQYEEAVKKAISSIL